MLYYFSLACALHAISQPMPLGAVAPRQRAKRMALAGRFSPGRGRCPWERRRSRMYTEASRTGRHVVSEPAATEDPTNDLAICGVWSVTQYDIYR